MKFHSVFTRLSLAVLLIVAAPVVPIASAASVPGPPACPLTSTPTSPIPAGSLVTLEAPFCPGPGADTLGYTTRSGIRDDVHTWTAVGAAVPPTAGAGPSATVTLDKPGDYTYRVNRKLGYLRTNPPPTAIVLYDYGDTDITITVANTGPDTTPDQFSFASVGNQPRNRLCVSSATTITGINAPTPVGIPGAGNPEYSIDGGAFTSSLGSISNGQTIALRLTTASTFSTGTTATLNVGGVSGSFTCSTEAIDTTPDPFTFAPVTDAPLSSICTAKPIPILGFNAPTSISIGASAGHEYSIEGAAFTSAPGTINSGQSFAVRQPSSNSPGTTTTLSVSVGGISGNFACTTLGPDTVPDRFAFTPVAGAAKSTPIVSNPQIIAGTNAPAPISVSNGEYSIGTAPFTASNGSISSGDSVRVRHTSAAAASTDVRTVLTIGGVPADFVSTTAASDTTPDRFSFAPLTGIPLSTQQISAPALIAGIDASTPLSVSGGEYSINGATFASAPAQVVNGDAVRLRHTSAGTPGTDVVTTLTVGGVVGTFRSTTLGPDTTPDQFTFTAQTGVPRASVVVSDAQTISGTNTAAPITVTNGEYAIGGGAYTAAAGTINSSDSVRVRHTASATASASVTTTLVIGGVSANFVSTTAAADTTPDAITFNAQGGVPVSSVITSSIATIAGIDAATPISVAGGEYAVNAGAFTKAQGTVNLNDRVQVRHTSASAALTDTVTTLTVGPVIASFTSTTVAATITTIPTVVIIPPTDADSLIAPASFRIIIEVNDPSGIAVFSGIELSISGDKRSATATSLACRKPRAARCVVYIFGVTNLGAANYTVSAALAYSNLGVSATATSAPIRIQVRTTIPATAPVGNITLSSAPTALLPGSTVALSVKAVDTSGAAMSDIALRWAITNGNAASSQSRAASGKKLACSGPENDNPLGGTLRTNAQGVASFSFTASCAAGSREITVSTEDITPSIERKFLLAGVNQRASEVSLVNQSAGSTILITGATAVAAQVNEGAQGAPFAQTTWAITPASAGSVSARVQADQSGRAANSVSLATGVSAATLVVCLEGRNETCKTYSLKTAATALTVPAIAITAPLVQQSITGTRVQLNQMSTRMQQLRSEQSRGFYNGIGIGVPGARVPTGDKDASSPGSDSSSDGGEKSGQRNVPTKPWGFFTVGDIELSQKQGDAGFKVGTQGLTAGVDYRFSRPWVAGATVGYLRGSTELNGGGKQKATGYSVGLFTQWVPENNVFANIVVNTGRGSYDISRIAEDGALLKASPKSTQLGMQGELGYMGNFSGVRVQPYLRAELTRASVDPVVETGGPAAISVDAQKVRASTFAFGTVIDYSINSASGVWIPSARLELLTEARKQNDTFVRLVNGSAVFVPLTAEPLDKQFGTFALNLQWITGVAGTPISSFIGVEHTFGKSGFKNNRFMLGVKVPL